MTTKLCDISNAAATTEKYYAKYMAIETYQNPWIVPEGYLPPDLLAELDSWHVTKTSTGVTTDATGISK
ncbi:MAG: hypothetical protein GY910_05570 [bacterium]|nr:hypothetical protein [Deltaproteobacteria bacterium]MCP4904429.1 hypothetical protein [bacterium]